MPSQRAGEVRSHRSCAMGRGLGERGLSRTERGEVRDRVSVRPRDGEGVEQLKPSSMFEYALVETTANTACR